LRPWAAGDALQRLTSQSAGATSWAIPEGWPDRPEGIRSMKNLVALPRLLLQAGFEEVGGVM